MGHLCPSLSIYPFLFSSVPQESRATLRHYWLDLSFQCLSSSEVYLRLLSRVTGVLRGLEQNLQGPLRPHPRNSTASIQYILSIKENPKASSDLKRNERRIYLLVEKSTSHIAKRHVYRKWGLSIPSFAINYRYR